MNSSRPARTASHNPTPSIINHTNGSQPTRDGEDVVMTESGATKRKQQPSVRKGGKEVKKAIASSETDEDSDSDSDDDVDTSNTDEESGVEDSDEDYVDGGARIQKAKRAFISPETTRSSSPNSTLDPRLLANNGSALSPTALLSAPISDYELQRQRRIEENQRMMASVFGFTGNRPVSATLQLTSTNTPKKTVARPYKRLKSLAQPRVQQRYSRRARGQEATTVDFDIEELENGVIRLDKESGEVVRNHRNVGGVDPESVELQSGSFNKSSWWKGKRGATVLSTTLPLEIHAPISLASIGTTIWDLGKIYTGTTNRKKYWSGKGSTFRHPYPVGFKAEKFYFRNTFTMEILESDDGPEFVLTTDAGQVFRGNSPTHPWTLACLASSSKGTRISGPLFFGFSDPLVQRMLTQLEGYQPWEVVSAQIDLEERLLGAQ